MDDKRVVSDGRVQLRVVAQGLGHGTGDEGKVGETDPLLFAEPVLVRFAHPFDPLVVGFDHHQGVSRGRLRPDHVLGGEAADVRERHDLVALAGDGRVGS